MEFVADLVSMDLMVFAVKTKLVMVIDVVHPIVCMATINVVLPV